MKWLLWKEYRDNRLTLVATAVLSLLALMILGFWDGGTFLQEQDAAEAAATVVGWCTWMFLTCSLFGSEWHRKHALWLARTPRGLGWAWVTKVAFATLAALLMAIWAWGCAKGVVAGLGIPPSLARYELMVSLPSMWLLGLVGAWLVAASCWGLRPGFVLFVAPAAAILLNAPYLGALLEKHWSLPIPNGWDFVRSAAVALIVGYLAFTKYRPQQPANAVGWTLCLIVLGHSPALWTWGERYRAGTVMDFATGRYSIESLLLSPNGRYAYLTTKPLVTRFDHCRWFALDTRTGDLKKLGEGKGPLHWANDLTLSSNGQSNGGTVQTPSAHVGDQPNQRWNANTAEQGGVPTAEATNFDSLAFAAKYPEIWRRKRIRLLTPLGFGYRAMIRPMAGIKPNDFWVYDPFLNELTPWERGAYSVKAVLQNGWLLQGDSENPGEYFYYDPKTKKMEPNPRLTSSDRYVTTSAEGNLLFQRASGVVLYNPQSKTVTPVQEVGRIPNDREGAPGTLWGPFKLFFSSPPGDCDSRWLMAYTATDSRQIGRYDSEQNVVTWGRPLPSSFEPVAAHKDKILGIGQIQDPRFVDSNQRRHILAFEIESGELELIFPKPNTPASP